MNSNYDLLDHGVILVSKAKNVTFSNYLTPKNRATFEHVKKQYNTINGILFEYTF